MAWRVRLLDVGIASSYHIAKFWGVTEKQPMPALQVNGEQRAAPTPEPVPATWIQRLRTGVRRVLRQAGLVEWSQTHSNSTTHDYTRIDHVESLDSALRRRAAIRAHPATRSPPE